MFFLTHKQLSSDCPWAVELIRSNQKRVHEFTRCGFKGKTVEICCKMTNTALRKAEQACEKIKKLKVIDPPHIEYRIIEGEPVEAGEFPHQVALGFESIGNPNTIDYSCTGSLISKVCIYCY